MKKLIILFILFSATATVYGQKDKSPKQKKDTAGYVVYTPPIHVTNVIDWAPGVLVYERPNYQGRSASFTKNAEGKFVFPFPIKNASLKVPDGKIIYIRKCFEFPSEAAYTESQKVINLEAVCGVRTDTKAKLRVTLNGISTEIHNRDCYRFGGKIEIKVMEDAPDNAAESQMKWTIIEAGSPPIHSDRYTYPIFTNDSVLIDRPGLALELNQGYIFNNNPVPHLTEQARYGRSVKQNSTNVFIVGKSALESGRVRVWVKTNLVSAHKNCDLCDDFSNNIRMSAPAYAFVPVNKPYDGGKLVNAANPYVVLGPYTARGSRTGFGITASAGTEKNFRVHLKVNPE